MNLQWEHRTLALSELLGLPVDFLAQFKVLVLALNSMIFPCFPVLQTPIISIGYGTLSVDFIAIFHVCSLPPQAFFPQQAVLILWQVLKLCLSPFLP